MNTRRVKQLMSIVLLCTLVLSPTVAFAAAPSGNWTDAGIPVDFTASAANTGRGGTSAADAYLIGTAAELAFLAANPGATSGVYYRLTADIDLSAHYWTPIGTTTSTPFRGHLDGDGYIVSGVTIDTSATGAQGFIGVMANGSVRNLFVEVDIDAPSANNVGALIGNIYSFAPITATLKNCRSDGWVSGNRFVGGMIGNVALYDGGANVGALIVDACVANVTVSASLDAGGFIGHIMCVSTVNVSIANSAALGAVTSTQSPAALSAANQWEGTGGFVGQLDCGSGSLDRCYATGAVQGVNNVGGFIGLALGASYNKVTSNCFSSGTVTGVLQPFNTTGANARRAGGNAGGFIGANDLSFPALSITSCYTNSPMTVTTASNSSIAGNIGGFAGLLSTVCLSSGHVTNNYFDADLNPGLATVGMVAVTGLPSDGSAQTNVNPPNVSGQSTAAMTSARMVDSLNADSLHGGMPQTPLAWFADTYGVNSGYPVLACQTISFSFSDLIHTYDGTAKQATVTQQGELSLIRNADWWVFYDNLKSPLPVDIGLYDVTVRIPGYVAIPPQDAVLEIAAAPVFYTITASAGTGGTITPSGVVSVAEGASQKFIITPAAGYKIKDVVIDGVSYGSADNLFWFTEVNANHTIHVEFEPIGGGGNGGNGGGGTNGGGVPATGDTASVIGYSLMLAALLCLNVGVVATRRKK